MNTQVPLKNDVTYINSAANIRNTVTTSPIPA